MYKNILLTLNHMELDRRLKITPLVILERIKELFINQNILLEQLVVSKESHSDGGFHYHVGIKHSGFTKRINLAKTFRSIFVEFEGCSINVIAKKSFNVIISYITKEDENPFLYNITMEEILHIDNSINQKKSADYLLDKLKEKNSWVDVLEDPEFATRLLHGYFSLKNLFLDLQKNKKILLYKDNMGKMLQKKEKNCLESLEKFNKTELSVLKWFNLNLNNPRNFRQDQLLIIGSSQTGKSSFIKLIIEALGLLVYEVSSDDFSNYLDSLFDIILLDEFNFKKFDRSFLLKLLDGSTLDYTGKYQEVKLKRKNIPIVLICNTSELPPHGEERWEAFYKRLEIHEFSVQKEKNALPLYTKQDIINVISYLYEKKNIVLI